LNKIAPIAFILLLSCGVALWFLASDSLNAHIKSQLQTLTSKLSQQNVTVENVTIRSYQGTGTISNIIIYGSYPDRLKNNENPTLSIDSIELAINRESLKEEIINIESITIHGLTASYTDTKNGTSLDQLLATVQKNLPELTSINDVNIDKKSKQNQKIPPPLLKVVKVIIKPGVLQYVSNNKGETTSQPLPQIEWNNISAESGETGETVGIKIFEQLLIELSERSKKRLSSN
jgi:hypothetical protein